MTDEEFNKIAGMCKKNNISIYKARAYYKRLIVKKVSKKEAFRKTIEAIDRKEL